MMRNEAIRREQLQQYRQEAEELGLTLQEYLLFLQLEQLERISAEE